MKSIIRINAQHYKNHSESEHEHPVWVEKRGSQEFEILVDNELIMKFPKEAFKAFEKILINHSTSKVMYKFIDYRICSAAIKLEDELFRSYLVAEIRESNIKV